MQTQITNRIICSVGAAMCLLFGSFATAADVSGGANGINVSRVSSNAQIRVTGPNGYSSESSGARAKSSDGAPLADGVYRYEVTEVKCGNVSYAEIKTARRDNAANGRDADAQPSSCRDVVVDSGSFRIVNGAIPSSALVEE